jgi:hypothetical protein
MVERLLEGHVVPFSDRDLDSIAVVSGARAIVKLHISYCKRQMSLHPSFFQIEMDT